MTEDGKNSSAANPGDQLSAITYSKKWNVVDFLGKNHLSKIANQKLAVPGTTINEEKHHIIAKLKDAERFEKELQQRAEKRHHRDFAKLQMSAMSTRVHFRTIVEAPLETVEGYLNEREVENSLAKPKVLDHPDEIGRFMKNVRLGRHHYIGFAVVSGYRSINYQTPGSGDTAMHIAARKGDIECLEELLKYKANPDIKNDLGNHPAHDAWMFWPYEKFNLTPAQRAHRNELEKKTNDILRIIFSYGGFVNCQNQDGETPLHTAARLGTLEIATTILGFKADMTIKSLTGETPMDVALKFKQVEIYRLLKLWDEISRSMVHSDFVVIWHTFLKDSKAVISNHQAAETVLFDVDMNMRVNALNRAMQQHVMVDDPLLRQTFQDASRCPKYPKPWEDHWEEYKEVVQGQRTAEAERVAREEEQRIQQEVKEELRVQSAKVKAMVRSRPSTPAAPDDLKSLATSPSPLGRAVFAGGEASPSGASIGSVGLSEAGPGTVEQGGRKRGARVGEMVEVDAGSVSSGGNGSLALAQRSQDQGRTASVNVEVPPTDEGGDLSPLGSPTGSVAVGRHGEDGADLTFGGHHGDHGDQASTAEGVEGVENGSVEMSRGADSASVSSLSRKLAALTNRRIIPIPNRPTPTARPSTRGLTGVSRGATASKAVSPVDAIHSLWGSGSGADPISSAISHAGSKGGDIKSGGKQEDKIEDQKNGRTEQGEGGILQRADRDGRERGGGESVSSDLTDRDDLDFDRDGDDGHLGAGGGDPSRFDPIPMGTVADRFFSTTADVQGGGQRGGGGEAGRRPMSQVQLRRQGRIDAIKLDAKFQQFTRRPATSSNMFVSQRTPLAPLEGTPEEFSVLRAVTSQGIAYEMVHKNKKYKEMERIKAVYGHIPEPPRSSLGDYRTELSTHAASDRDKLNARLVKGMSDLEASEAMVKSAMQGSTVGAQEQAQKNLLTLKRTKIDLVHDKRSRFVDPLMLPPTRVAGVIEQMAAKAKEKMKQTQQKRLGLGGEESEAAAREKIEAEILDKQYKDKQHEGEGEGDHGDDASEAHSLSLTETQRVFLDRPIVEYGKGRLKSTHNCKIPLEGPWNTVPGNYSLRPGDHSG